VRVGAHPRPCRIRVNAASGGYAQAVLTILIIVAIIVVLLVVFAVGPFGESGVSRARENAYWKGGAGPNPPLRYDPDARFEPPADGR
jgi:hypothetical protein